MQFQSINENWDYRGAKKVGLHSLGKYPATMVADMQLKLLEEWTSKTDQTVMDPFMGSGTSIVEAQQLGFKTIEIDINPYAVLLANVKTHSYDHIDWSSVVSTLKDRLCVDKETIHPFYFNGIKKWFRTDIIISLTIVRAAIQAQPDIWVRRFLWVCLSKVIYTRSNKRTSTFKLHSKTDEQIHRIPNDIEKSFLKIVLNDIKVLHMDKVVPADIYMGDSKEILQAFSDGSVDVICTSPPYGENATTVTYGQASILFLKWIDEKDIQVYPESLKTLSSIDSLSLGGKRASEDVYSSPRLEIFINSVAEGKRRKVRRFVSDYWLVTKELTRIISRGGIAMYTVGNRRVDGIQQPLDLITIDMYESQGFSLESQYRRKIFSKTIPRYVSGSNGRESVQSMSQESILIFRKNI